MPYAYVTPENKIRKVAVKLSPFERVLQGERIASYNEPKYDPQLQQAVPIEPVVGDSVQFTLKDLPNSFETLKARKVQLVQKHLDSKAQEKAYDSILSAVSYAVDSQSPFYTEGLAYAAWRSQCWTTTFDILDKVASNEVAMPSDIDLIAMLPKLSLPTQ